MTDIYLTGALIFVGFVVIAVTIYALRARRGLEPPQYQSYFVGIVLLAASFVLLRQSSVWVDPSDAVATAQATAAAIQQLTTVVSAVLLIAAFWILTEKSRMQRYFERLS